MKKHKIKSFCKINLTLRVIKKLDDGYHAIKSLVTFCSLHDVISIEKIEGSKDKIVFSGPFKNGISKTSNTVSQLLKILREKKLLRKQAFYISIKKNIPHGSGLGGGSANAAYLLNFLNFKMSLKLSKKKVKKIAKKIGSDVLISLKKENKFLTGYKDKIIKINKFFNLIVLIVYPNLHCPTKKIYEKNKNFSNLKKEKNIFKNKKEIIRYLKNETNDLQEAAIKLHPKIENIINFIKFQKGCYFSRITGSGSACIGIFSDVKHAIYAKKLVKMKFPKYWCVLSKTI